MLQRNWVICGGLFVPYEANKSLYIYILNYYSFIVYFFLGFLFANPRKRISLKRRNQSKSQNDIKKQEQPSPMLWTPIPIKEDRHMSCPKTYHIFSHIQGIKRY